MKPIVIVLILLAVCAIIGLALKESEHKPASKVKSCLACSNKVKKYQQTDIPARTYNPGVLPGPIREELNPYNDHYDNTDITSHPTENQAYTYDLYRLML